MWHVAVDVALRHALLGIGGEGKTRSNMEVTALFCFIYRSFSFVTMKVYDPKCENDNHRPVMKTL